MFQSWHSVLIRFQSLGYLSFLGCRKIPKNTYDFRKHRRYSKVEFWKTKQIKHHLNLNSFFPYSCILGSQLCLQPSSHHHQFFSFTALLICQESTNIESLHTNFFVLNRCTLNSCILVWINYGVRFSFPCFDWWRDNLFYKANHNYVIPEMEGKKLKCKVFP